MSSNPRPRVFLDVAIASEVVGRLTIELFTDKTPKTCEKFRQLCTGEFNGLSYAGSRFNRIVDEFMVQGGDILNDDRTRNVSTYGEDFGDENLNWRELDAANLVCSANRGKDSNGSQFFITLAPCLHLNGRHTIFGRLVSGEEALGVMARVTVNDDDRPTEPVTVIRCGDLERRNKTQLTKVSRVNAEADRGRSRDEDKAATRNVDGPCSKTVSRKRRPSDNVRDEGLRGRPRKRSRTRTETSAIEEDSASAESNSPVKLHKRRRSPSPSPAYPSTEEHSYERRRRRSLPNQYNDKRRYGARDNLRSGQHHHDRRADFSETSSRQHHYHGHGRHRESPERWPDQGRHSLHISDDGSSSAIKFKGRGTMKFREPGRLQ